MAHWTNDLTELANFELECLDVLQDCNYPAYRPDRSTDPEGLKVLHAWPFFDKLTNYLTRADAVLSFQDWVIHRYVGGQKIPGMMRFEVQVTYKLPPLAAAASVTFGVSGVLPSANSDLRDRAFEWLTMECNRAYSMYLAGANAGLPAGARGAGGESFRVIALMHTFDKNEHVYKCKGGMFSAHGLRVYPELLRAVGIDPEKIPMGETVPKKQWSATIAFNKDGKAYKVAELNEVH